MLRENVAFVLVYSSCLLYFLLCLWILWKPVLFDFDVCVNFCTKIIFIKRFILEVWQGSEYAHDFEKNTQLIFPFYF